MRTTKELLELMLENKQLFRTGLCALIGDMFCDDIISHHEYSHIYKYITGNRAGNARSYSAYWFNCGEIEPRIEWIKQHIELNS